MTTKLDSSNRSHRIELVIETPENYLSMDVAKEVAGECEYVWCNADGERSYLREWNVVSVEGRTVFNREEN